MRMSLYVCIYGHMCSADRGEGGQREWGGSGRERGEEAKEGKGREMVRERWRGREKAEGESN